MTTTAVRCRAKDPATCRNHGTPVTAELTRENLEAEVRRAMSPAKSLHPCIQQSLTSSLEWTGEKPQWWATFTSTAQQHAKLPTTPELLDIITTPQGESIAVVWQEDSHADADLYVTEDGGLQVQALLLLDAKTGQEIGAIRASHRDEASYKRSYGDDQLTPFRWYSQNTGDFSYYGPENEDDSPDFTPLTPEREEEELRKIWRGCARDTKGAAKTQIYAYREDGIRLQSYEVREEHAPEDMNKIRADIARYAETVITPQFEEQKKGSVVPYVDYSTVEEEYRGRGLGTTMYVYAARQLAKKHNTALRGSGIQSDDAQAVWARFKKHFPNQVKKMKIAYKGYENEYFTFDFR